MSGLSSSSTNKSARMLFSKMDVNCNNEHNIQSPPRPLQYNNNLRLTSVSYNNHNVSTRTRNDNNITTRSP